MEHNDYANDAAQNGRTDQADQGADAAAQGSESATAESDSAAEAGDAAAEGPQTELPDAAPEFVGEIHDVVGDGAAVSGEVIREIVSAMDVAAAADAAAQVATVIPA